MTRARNKRLPRSSGYDDRYVTERRRSDGSIRRYWQVPGQKPVRLPDDLDWAKTATQLNRQRDATLGKTVVVDGSMAWTIQKYRETPRFKRLSDSSKTVYERWLVKFEELWGALPPAAISRKVAVDFIEIYNDMPATQNHAAVVLYNVLKRAKYHGLIVASTCPCWITWTSPRWVSTSTWPTWG